MNRLFFSFLFIVFSYVNAFNEWIEINKKLLKHKNKLITFNLTRNGNRDEVLYVKIALSHNKIFRFERGNRTVISNGKLSTVNTLISIRLGSIVLFVPLTNNNISLLIMLMNHVQNEMLISIA